MIRLDVTEQELFDIIVAVHAAGRTEAGIESGELPVDQAGDALERRADLLEKLHDIFDANVMSAYQRLREPQGAGAES
jgi:hypothetical protein